MKYLLVLGLAIVRNDAASMPSIKLAAIKRRSPAQEFRELALSITPTTDKVTDHSYQEMHGTFTRIYRGKSIKMLEIGLGCGMLYGPGASAQLWRKWLGKDAEIWFAEYNKECAEKHHDKLVHLNISAVTGDQADLKVLDEWLQETGGNFDYIVDDGGHTGRQKFNTFTKLWESVKPGGLFFVEDMQVDKFGSYVSPGFPPFAVVVETWVDQLLIGNIFDFSKEPTDNSNRARFPIPPKLKAIYCSDEICAMKKCNAEDIGRHCKLDSSIDEWKQHMLASVSG
jgi:hypothetical protein